MQILGVVASGNSIYRLAQTYTSTSTYTVPNGVYQIAGIAIARGGVAASGLNASSGNSGAGGGGAGGGAIMGFWAFNVTPGETWSISFAGGDTTIAKTTDGNAFINAGRGQDASGRTGGAGGLTTKGSSIFSNQSINANGTTGGDGGIALTVNGFGNIGFPSQPGSLWTPFGFPHSIAGLPTNLYSGAGGAGGGSGAKAANLQFNFGGTGGVPNGGQGGDALQDFNLNGYSGSNGVGTYADGAGGGGGGAFQTGYGSGNGGGVGTSGTGIAYIYER